MPRLSTKWTNVKTVSRKRRLAGNARRPVTINDVIAALMDLLAKLQIDANQLTSRVNSLERSELPPHRLYSHNATIGELLTAWHQNPEYLDNLGDPVPIKMRGGRRSFTALAKKAVPSIDAPRLLAELRRLGAVTVDTNRFIHVNMRSLSVYGDRRLAVHYTLTSLHNYIKTLNHNLDSDPMNVDQLFHRIAWNDAFDRDLIPLLKIKLRRQGQSFLESFDNWMTRRSKLAGPAPKKRKTAQVSVGVYIAIA
jgi:hypothetical protein